MWDYAGDNYVHRLIQSSTDGKMVEYQGQAAQESQKTDEKISAIQLEYSCLLTGQLENQRMYFEEKLRETEERFKEYAEGADERIKDLDVELKSIKEECEGLRRTLAQTKLAKEQAEKKAQQATSKVHKLQSELDEERQMSKLIREDKDLLTRQRDELEKLRNKEIAGLEEQINDLMMHFEAQSRLRNQLANANVTAEELEAGTLEVRESQPPVTPKGKKHKKKSTSSNS